MSGDSLCLACIGVEQVGITLVAGKGAHACPHLLGVIEQVCAMFGVDSRDTIQQTALETQGNGSTRRSLDGVTGLRHVDAFDDPAGQLAVDSVVAEVGNKPVVGQRWML